ncbi:MAG: hypothetical protein A2W25_12215 [candidate division Zixibacteria bacterium RBG_16_53_22]|nr:MAG: hypothetical protein A2W25_12215 [candidate division Zixibacteria bacterium RBG_16_53_22]
MAKRDFSWLELHEAGYDEWGEEIPGAAPLHEIAQAQYERAHQEQLPPMPAPDPLPPDDGRGRDSDA